MLDVATSLEDLKYPPGNRLKKLLGDRRGKHSIRINDQYRICFLWRVMMHTRSRSLTITSDWKRVLLNRVR